MKMTLPIPTSWMRKNSDGQTVSGAFAPLTLRINSVRMITAAIGIGFCWATSPLARAQATPPGTILYNNFDFSSGQPVAQLSRINPDGTGNRGIPVNLPEPGFPSVSRDGRYLALTSADPAKAFTLSRDVFLFDLVTAQSAKLTSFPNNWDSLATNSLGNLDISQAGYTLPWYKAFSPDNLHLAVSSDVVSGATFTYTNSLNPQDNDLASGFTSTAVLTVYNFDGSPPITVAVGGADPDVHGGDGVDWSPNLNLLVWPSGATAVSSGISGGNLVPVTALFIMLPVADAMGSGHALQLTFPQASQGLLPNWGGIYLLWETDYQPAFSPDGKQVAYVRADSITETGLLGYVSKPSLRVVNVDGTNDREITNFDVGLYVTHLSWSPDGTQLVFDLGQQAVGPMNFPYLLAIPQTDALYTISTNGTGLTQLQAAPATWPVWWSAPTASAPPRLSIGLASGGQQLTIGWSAGAGIWSLETSAQLGAQANWQSVTNAPVTSGGQQIVTLSTRTGNHFFRLKKN
jgi:WD40 repeat protein